MVKLCARLRTHHLAPRRSGIGRVVITVVTWKRAHCSLPCAATRNRFDFDNPCPHPIEIRVSSTTLRVRSAVWPSRLGDSASHIDGNAGRLCSKLFHIAIRRHRKETDIPSAWPTSTPATSTSTESSGASSPRTRRGRIGRSGCPALGFVRVRMSRDDPRHHNWRRREDVHKPRLELGPRLRP